MKPENENGTYSVRRPRKNSVDIRAEGKLDGDGDGRNCRLTMTVLKDSFSIQINRR